MRLYSIKVLSTVPGYKKHSNLVMITNIIRFQRLVPKLRILWEMPSNIASFLVMLHESCSVQHFFPYMSA